MITQFDSIGDYSLPSRGTLVPLGSELLSWLHCAELLLQNKRRPFPKTRHPEGYHQGLQPIKINMNILAIKRYNYYLIIVNVVSHELPSKQSLKLTEMIHS